jgi:hypothetical protein
MHVDTTQAAAGMHPCETCMGRYMPWGVPANGATPYFRGPEHLHLHVRACACVWVRLTPGVPTHGRLQHPTAASH